MKRRDYVGNHSGFADRKKTYYYLGGFDPEFERLSLGTLVVSHAIERAMLEGIEEFDFLRGSEAYKYLWGARDQLTYRRSIHHRTSTVS